MTRTQALLIILRWLVKHIVRRWYIYATLILIYAAPLPVVLALALGWLGFFIYTLHTTQEKDTL